jgi:DUF1680 family protein
LPGYVATTSDEGIWIHLYAESEIDVTLPNDRQVRLTQHTRYPWDGRIEIAVEGDGEFTLFLRIPGWCDGANLEINGESFGDKLSPGSYAAIDRVWRTGDIVRLDLPMDVGVVEAHPYVAENAGKVAVFRGPILYCVEQADNPGLDPRDVGIRPTAVFNPEHWGDTLYGVTALRTTGVVEHVDPKWTDKLYRVAGSAAPRSNPEQIQLTLIPYFAWGNREHGPMEVWLRSMG